MTREELIKTHGEEVCEHCVEIGNYQAIMNGLECYGQICQNTQDNFCYDNDINLEVERITHWMPIQKLEEDQL